MTFACRFGRGEISPASLRKNGNFPAKKNPLSSSPAFSHLAEQSKKSLINELA